MDDVFAYVPCHTLLAFHQTHRGFTVVVVVAVVVAVVVIVSELCYCCGVAAVSGAVRLGVQRQRVMWSLGQTRLHPTVGGLVWV